MLMSMAELVCFGPRLRGRRLSAFSHAKLIDSMLAFSLMNGEAVGKVATFVDLQNFQSRLTGRVIGSQQSETIQSDVASLFHSADHIGRIQAVNRACTVVVAT